ncbi:MULTISPECIES: iron-siderophore ABC transporter substrate-binding protein [Billgrantia]|uniref:Iron-siderophore ABC transporter substrate-binding protein n=1 Tax=Billgrantia aerodenitrificans TaxID=2733483 RepID=A0ABS9AQ05_9GAMM|nr:iron-siderophore ABC transporter substrate-binding protein [Halomonas desiderata]MCE8011917.1 iron-siderophore ABC transporter substrate-binding protein [Halomonas desiderata]MCE8023722.1 iron-siderophore ABC transporter substrate-binding protein [Halomonas aerodenitrificans]OUE43231.1 ABC transporter substrate-binding protein [Halomonas desiderata SP1]
MRNWVGALRLPLSVAVLALLPLTAWAERSVETAFGEVVVPRSPERVVTLYEGALDVALAAGVTPLGAVTTRGGDGMARYIEAHLGEQRPAIVGVVREINLEAVLALEPDVILAPPQLPEAQYRLLSRMAPTVVPLTEGLDPEAWRAETRLFAQALGREAEIEAALEQVDARAAEVAERIAADEAPSAVLVRWMPQGPMVMSADLFTAGLLRAAGVAVHDAGLTRENSPHSDPLSLENLSRVDADWLFLATLNEEGREALQAAQATPAFARLDVVARDQVVPVDGQLWSSATGPLAALTILDQLDAALTP